MYHCIINPRAGRSRGKELISSIEDFMKKHNKEIVIKEPISPQDSTDWVRDACLAKSEGIIGVGGDGTIQAIVTGMLRNSKECQIPLGIISCGSGNDLSRTFASFIPSVKQSEEDSLQQFLMRVIRGEHKTIDAIRVNDKVCLNVANMGLDARIVKNAKRYKKFLGGKAYLLSAIISIFQHENLGLHMFIEGEQKITIQNKEEIAKVEYEVKSHYTLLAICNGQYYGGGMRIAPSAKLNDGKITLCLIDDLSRAKAFRLFPTILIQKHMYLKDVNYLECTRIKIIPERSQISLCMDGNLSDVTGALEVNLLPNAIKVTF